MRIAVVNEVSSCAKNADILSALELTGMEFYNVGMTNPEDEPSLTYIHTGFISAVLLNTGACDMVVGGCGTGQGYLNSVMQYPGVFAGLIQEPLDAWLFSQINAGNCISLALNKGYGWAGDINIKYIFEKLFADEHGKGYPQIRAESQSKSRDMLKKISEATHKPFCEIAKNLDDEILAAVSGVGELKAALENRASNLKVAQELKSIIFG